MREVSLQVTIFFLFFAVYVFISLKIPVVYLEDSMDFILRAQKMEGKFYIENYVNGYYPFGYPWLLKILTPFTKDYLLSQKLISIFSGSIGLVLFYKICRIFFNSSISLFATLFLSVNKTFVILSTTDNTDLPATILVLGSMYVLLNNSASRNSIFLGGLLLGLSYMMRYTALVFIPVILTWLMLGENKLRNSIINATLFLAGFLFFSAPQLVMSYVHQGSLFYNTQAVNVWFGIYGNNDFGSNWRAAQAHSSLLEIFKISPFHFMDNLWKNIEQVFFMTYFNFPLFILSFVGIIHLLIHKSIRYKGSLLILSWVWFGTVISMAFIRPRLIIYILPTQVLFGVMGMEYIINLANKYLVSKKPFIFQFIRYGTLVLVLILMVKDHMVPILKQPISDEQKEILMVGKSLTRAGMDSPGKVLSFSFRAYDVDSPNKTGFQLPWYWQGQEYHSVGEIIGTMKTHQYQFLVYDKNAIFNIKSLDTFWESHEHDSLFIEHFSPLYQGKYYKAYKLKN